MPFHVLDVSDTWYSSSAVDMTNISVTFQQMALLSLYPILFVQCFKTIISRVKGQWTEYFYCHQQHFCRLICMEGMCSIRNWRNQEWHQSKFPKNNTFFCVCVCNLPIETHNHPYTDISKKHPKNQVFPDPDRSSLLIQVWLRFLMYIIYTVLRLVVHGLEATMWKGRCISFKLSHLKRFGRAVEPTTKLIESKIDFKGPVLERSMLNYEKNCEKQMESFRIPLNVPYHRMKLERFRN